MRRAARLLLAPLLLLAACAPRAAASPVSVCRGRAESCSGHGDCDDGPRGTGACTCAWAYANGGPGCALPMAAIELGFGACVVAAAFAASYRSVRRYASIS